MTVRKKTVLVVGVALTAAVGLALPAFLTYSFEERRVGTFPSPDGSKKAYLVRHGALMSNRLALLVSSSGSINDMEWIGTVDSEDSPRFQELAWSQDSTLVAAQCYVTDMDMRLFTRGYDFSSSTRLVLSRDVPNDPRAWLTCHERIEQLFAQRGGQSMVVSRYDLDEKMKRMKWLEWRQWRIRIDDARRKAIGR